MSAEQSHAGSHQDNNNDKSDRKDQNSSGQNNNDQDSAEGFQFDHIAQQVPDIAQAVSWYMQLLPQAKVLYQDTSWAFVEASGTKLAFVKEDQHPNHLAWRVSDALLEQLAARYNKTVALHRDKTRSIYLEAPGGQAIEIISFDGSDWQKAETEAKQS